MSDLGSCGTKDVPDLFGVGVRVQVSKASHDLGDASEQSVLGLVSALRPWVPQV